MGQLPFKKCFHADIALGRKRATIRRWTRCHLAPGDRVHAGGVGWLIIESADPVRVENLRESDAVADGFASLSDLRAALRRIYPHAAADGKQWFRIRFHVEKKRLASRPPTKKPAVSSDARRKLASEIRVQLDKAVGRARSSASL